MQLSRVRKGAEITRLDLILLEMTVASALFVRVPRATSHSDNDEVGEF